MSSCAALPLHSPPAKTKNQTSNAKTANPNKPITTVLLKFFNLIIYFQNYIQLYLFFSEFNIKKGPGDVRRGPLGTAFLASFRQFLFGDNPAKAGVVFGQSQFLVFENGRVHGAQEIQKLYYLPKFLVLSVRRSFKLLKILALFPESIKNATDIGPAPEKRKKVSGKKKLCPCVVDKQGVWL